MYRIFKPKEIRIEMARLDYNLGCFSFSRERILSSPPEQQPQVQSALYRTNILAFLVTINVGWRINRKRSPSFPRK